MRIPRLFSALVVLFGAPLVVHAQWNLTSPLNTNTPYPVSFSTSSHNGQVVIFSKPPGGSTWTSVGGGGGAPGSQITATGTISFSVSGTWTIKAVDGGTAISPTISQITREVSATAPPVNQASVAISPTTATVIAGGSATFTASGGSGTGAYTWGGTAGATGTGASKTVTFPTAGTFTVTAFRAGDATYAASATASVTVTVNSNPELTTVLGTVDGGEEGYWDCYIWYEYVWIDEDYGYWEDFEDCYWEHDYFWYVDAVQVQGTTNGCPVQLTVTFSDNHQEVFSLTGNGGNVYQDFFYTEFDPYPVSATAVQTCGYVTAITGLPLAVCPNEDYTVTALSSDGQILPFLQWGGNATLVSQSGNAATLFFNSPASNLVVWAQANNQPSPPRAQTTTDVVATEILLDGTVISSGSIVYIDASPVMPPLKARLQNSSGMTGTVDWKINVLFNRSNRNDSTDLISSSNPATATWDVPWGGTFYGGTATITATYHKSGNSVQLCASHLTHIRGINPPVGTLESYIGVSPWYAVAISRQEHGPDGLQFNTVGTEGPNFLAQIKNTPNRSSDGIGWGVYQLTNPAPSATEVWNWRANVDSAKSRMVGHHIEADNWIAGQEAQQMNEAPAQLLINRPFTWGSSVVFQKGTAKTPQDACAIQRYNGVAGGWVIWWDNALQLWSQRSSSYVTGVVSNL